MNISRFLSSLKEQVPLPSPKEQVFHLFLLLLLTITEVAVHHIVFQDFSLLNGKDEGWHMENARTYAEVLWLEPKLHSISEMFEAKVEYPPAVYLSSLASQILLQSESWLAIYLGLAPFYLLLNFSLYFLSKKLFGSPETGVWAAMLLTLCPIFLHHLGIYNLQIPLMALVAPMYLALVYCDSFRNGKYVALFFALLAFGFLTYVWAIMLVWLPAVLFFVFSIIRNKQYRLVILKNILSGLLLFAVLIAPYMAWPTIWDSYTLYLPMIDPGNTEKAVAFSQEGGRLFYIYKLPETLGLPVLLLFLWGLTRLKWKNAIQVGWILCGLGILIFLSLFTNVYEERTLPLCLVASVIAAFGLTSTLPFLKRKKFILLGFIACTLIIIPDYFSTSVRRSELDLRAPMNMLNHRCSQNEPCNLNVFWISGFWSLDLLQKTDPAFSNLNQLLNVLKGKQIGHYSHYIQFYRKDETFISDLPPWQRGPAQKELEKFQAIKPRLKLLYREAYMQEGQVPYMVSLWEDPEHFQK